MSSRWPGEATTATLFAVQMPSTTHPQEEDTMVSTLPTGWMSFIIKRKDSSVADVCRLEDSRKYLLYFYPLYI